MYSDSYDIHPCRNDSVRPANEPSSTVLLVQNRQKKFAWQRWGFEELEAHRRNETMGRERFFYGVRVWVEFLESG